MCKNVEGLERLQAGVAKERMFSHRTALLYRRKTLAPSKSEATVYPMIKAELLYCRAFLSDEGKVIPDDVEEERAVVRSI